MALYFDLSTLHDSGILCSFQPTSDLHRPKETLRESSQGLSKEDQLESSIKSNGLTLAASSLPPVCHPASNKGNRTPPTNRSPNSSSSVAALDIGEATVICLANFLQRTACTISLICRRAKRCRAAIASGVRATEGEAMLFR